MVVVGAVLKPLAEEAEAEEAEPEEAEPLEEDGVVTVTMTSGVTTLSEPVTAVV